MYFSTKESSISSKCSLNNKSFFSLINAIINDTINNNHINWAKEKVREIERDLQKDDVDDIDDINTIGDDKF